MNTQNAGHPPAPRAGRCTLVGAGPGDPDLLTLKAIKAIQAATVVLVDDLVSPAVVALAAPGARIVQVGKRGGCQSTPQAFIEKLMILAALEGERVVRLKGGDPLIFGRGGEEVEHLRAAGVEVAVINGITAGLAAATALGVALTHRDQARGVVFVTGHAKSARTPGADTDWQALAQAATLARLTLVIYMGVSGVRQMQQALLLGLHADTPTAVVENVSLPQERRLLTRLDRLSQDMAQAGLGSPAVIVIGDVLLGVQALQQAAGAEQAAHG